MKSWQEQCAEVIEYLEDHFPEVQYKINFRKDPKYGWSFIVESERKDGGPYHGTKLNLNWIQVVADNVESLPQKMLDKARERIMEWQKEGLDKVRLQAEELEKAKNELQKRFNANNILDKLAKEFETK